MTDGLSHLPQLPVLHDLDAEISFSSVKQVVRSLKNFKSPDADGITAEILRCRDDTLAARDVTRGRGKGGTIPQTPIHYGGAESLQGRRITAGGAEKSQQCHKYFLQYSKVAFERTQV